MANLKNIEIAKVLNISESNVGVKLHRIMKRLKRNEE
ncbi:sigma factor-like helix-turn-helix DNA-binding protein [Clostridium puniceum]|nr:LuxR C-terminal-related transcriptional regulator [Clostridium puniceum]